MKTIIAALGASVLLFLSQTSFAANERHDSDPRVSAGFGLATGSLRVNGRDVELVGLGSYIVHGARGCNGCHDTAAAARLDYQQFRGAFKARGSADASAAGAHAHLGERELRGVYEYWRAIPVQSGGTGRR
jgi:hypothetical protein